MQARLLHPGLLQASTGSGPVQHCADVSSHLAAGQAGQADMVRMATLDMVATDHSHVAAWVGMVVRYNLAV